MVNMSKLNDMSEEEFAEFLAAVAAEQARRHEANGSTPAPAFVAVPDPIAAAEAEAKPKTRTRAKTKAKA